MNTYINNTSLFNRVWFFLSFAVVSGAISGYLSMPESVSYFIALYCSCFLIPGVWLYRKEGKIAATYVLGVSLIIQIVSNQLFSALMSLISS